MKNYDLEQGPRTYIRSMVEELAQGWKFGYGYGWSSTEKVKNQSKFNLATTDSNSPLTRHSMENWGIGGTKIAGSSFGLIGTWASMLQYYFASYYQQNQPLTKEELNRQVLWSQQSSEIQENNEISKNYKRENVDENLAELYRQDPADFIDLVWKSYINISGPGEDSIQVEDPQNPNQLVERSILDALQLTNEGRNLDGYTEVLNTAWLEELYTGQQVPFIYYNRLNADEIRALQFAVNERDQLIMHEYEDLADVVNEADDPLKQVTITLYEVLLDVFYQKLYQVHHRKGRCEPGGKYYKAHVNNGTISRLKRVEKNFDCLHISGLLKINTTSRAQVRLTGTGKELFYLLAKGATPFFCGKYFILSPYSDPTKLKQLLEGMPQNISSNLHRNYDLTDQHQNYPYDENTPDGSTIRVTNLDDNKLVRLTKMATVKYEQMIEFI